MLAQALDVQAVQPISQTDGTIDGESCSILDFPSPKTEACHLAQSVASYIADLKLTPRDFVILVRQKAGEYAEILEPAFANENLALRNEAGMVGKVMLQELMTEEISKLAVNFLRLSMTPRAGSYWSTCQNWLASMRGIDADDSIRQSRLARVLDTYATELAARYSLPREVRWPHAHLLMTS